MFCDRDNTLSGERGIRGMCGTTAAWHRGVPCITEPYPGFFLGKIEGSRKMIRGVCVLILAPFILNALGFNNLKKKNPQGIFSLFPSLMDHILPDHLLMFCCGLGFFCF